MGKPIGPKKVHRYSNECKVTAVKLMRTATLEPGRQLTHTL
jgi:hypothetical protein